MRALILLLLFSTKTYALSCDSIENNVLTVCNDYLSTKDKDRLKKLCLYPNTIKGNKFIKAKFNEGNCSTEKVAAKCEVKSKDVVTYYYESNDLSKDELIQGCNFFKGSVFTNYTATNKKSKPSKVNAMDIQNNPAMKKYMECAKKAKSAEDFTVCRGFLKFN
jgi:hypothetical protein